MATTMFMVQLDGAVLGVALPTIAADFGVRPLSLSLAVTIYLTMLVALLPISGWAADRFGARCVFLGAVTGFALASLLCALSRSFWPFIVARALQGGAAALLAPVGRLIMLRRTPPDEMVDALSIIAMPMLIAPTIGPSVGGFIVSYASWPLIFLLNLPVAAGLIALTLRHVPPQPGDRARRLDAGGAVMLGLALVLVLAGADRLSGRFANPMPWILVLGGGVLGGLTVRHLRGHPYPVISLDSLAIPGYRETIIGSGAAIRVPQRALMFIAPLMFQIGLGMDALTAGLLLMMLSAGDMVIKPLVRPMFDRVGFRASITWSSLAGLAAMALMVVDLPPPLRMPGYGLMLLVAGMSRSVVFTGMTSLSFVMLPPEHVNSGNTLASISQQLTNALAVSASTLVVTGSAMAGGRLDPRQTDFSISMMVFVSIGAIATLALHPALPHVLARRLSPQK
ncbi:MAG: hypothetical protein RIS94_1693 [Pseudomonadota bacterium]